MASVTKRRSRRNAKRRERQRRAAVATPLTRQFPPPPDEPEGNAGVREPRLPQPSHPAGALELDLPPAVYLDLVR